MAEAHDIDRLKERYYFKRTADSEYTAPNLPKIVNNISRRIDRLNTVAQRLDEVVNGNLPPAQQLARVQQASDVLIVQLGRLEEMFELLEWSFGRSND